MRDIRPAPKKPFDKAQGKPGGKSFPLPEGDELYEITGPLKRAATPKKLPGKTVPTASVHVGEEEPSRPLFAKVAVGDTPKKDRKTRKPMRLGGRERQVLLVLFLVIGLVAILGGLIFLPKADVTLALKTAPLLIDQELIIRAAETDAANTVPGAAFFREVPIAGTSQVTSTEVVGAKASGTVQIVNKTIDEQKIKENSRLVTADDKLFFIQGAVFVPPNGRTSVTVVAAEAGEGGNIEPQRLDFAALPKESQSLVYAEATQKISGGTGEEVHVVKEEDIERAKAAAGDAAIAQVKVEVAGELPRGWVILEESWTAEVADFAVEGEVGARQPELPYSGRATVRVLGYEEAKLTERLQKALESRLDQDYVLFPGPISFTKTVKSVNWEASEGIIVARVTHTTIPDFSLDTLKQKIARRGEQEAREYLIGLPGVSRVDISLSPFWVRSIPRIEKRINLTLQPERQP